MRGRLHHDARLAAGEPDDGAGGEDAERADEEADHRPVGGVRRLLLEAGDGLVGGRRGGAGRRGERVVEGARGEDDARLQGGRAQAAVDGSEPGAALLPVGLVGDHGAHHAGLVDAPERGEHDGGAGGGLVLLLLAVLGDDAAGGLADDAGDAGARAVVEQRRHGQARELDDVRAHLPRHRQREDGRVHRAARLVVVLVAGRGDAEEGGRLAHGQVDEALGDALDALGELVFPAAQLLEEAAHDDDRRRVGARDLDVGVDPLRVEVLAQERRGGDAAEADVGRGAVDPRGLGLAQRVREDGGEGVEVVGLRLAPDADLGGADAAEDLAELDGALVHAAVGAEELPPDEHGAVREEDGDVVLGALAVLGDEAHRVVDLADHGLVVERVQGGELDQAEEGHDDVRRELAGVGPAHVLAGVLGHHVEPGLVRAPARGARGDRAPGRQRRALDPRVGGGAPARRA